MRNILMSFIMIVDRYIFFVGVNFYFMYVEDFLLATYKFKIVIFLVNLILHHFEISLFLIMLLWYNKNMLVFALCSWHRAPKILGIYRVIRVSFVYYEMTRGGWRIRVLGARVSVQSSMTNN